MVTEYYSNILFNSKKTIYVQKTFKIELSVCPKTGNFRCFAYVTVLNHVNKEIMKLNGLVFESKLIKIEDANIKPKTRSQQYKISGNSYNPIMQKQQTYHQHQSKYQQPAAQLMSILQSPNQQNSLLKSLDAMPGCPA